MTTVHYREVVRSDIPAMARIRLEGAEGEERLRDRITRYLDREHHPQHALLPRVIYVALEGETLVGYIAGQLTRRYDCDGELQWIYVVPEHRGTGVASELLRLLAAWFVEQHASRICVDVDRNNTRARRFYTRHGAAGLVDRLPGWLFWDDIRVALGESRG